MTDEEKPNTWKQLGVVVLILILGCSSFLYLLFSTQTSTPIVKNETTTITVDSNACVTNPSSVECDTFLKMKAIMEYYNLTTNDIAFNLERINNTIQINGCMFLVNDTFKEGCIIPELEKVTK